MLSAEPVPAKPAVAYCEGKAITFAPAAARRGRVLKIGDTILGPLVTDRKPSDRRPNLYVVAPGQQHHGPAQTDFNLIVNELPQRDEAVVWDVYWVLVLDPDLKSDFTGERELLMATQEGFTPAEHPGFDQIPSVGFLREYLRINSIAGLEPFRRADGTLPRVIMVPAGMAVRASAVDPDNPPVPEGRVARARK